MKQHEIPTKPELKDYLNQDKLKDACIAGNQEIIYQYVNDAINTFEKRLKVYYESKAISNSKTIPEDLKALYADLNELGLNG